MATLRSLCETVGWRDVVTYIQSGNVVFSCPQRALASSAAKLEAAIEASLAFRPGVVVRSLAEMKAALAASPFAREATSDPGKVLVMFLAAAPGAPAKKAILALTPEPERVVLIGREVHLLYPNGIGTSKFQFSQVEKAVKVPGTCRNWNTISKVLAMAEALEASDKRS
jgi:uncharacterized protein (DUF1697 family)